MKTRLLWALLLAPAATLGADREFDRLVKAVESRFGVERTHVPRMGVANFFVNVARPAGTKGFKLAVFEGVRAPLGEDRSELDQIMGQAAAGLRPLVRVHSNRGREATYIYTAEEGKNTKMLIATFERNEATVVQVKLSTEALLRSLENPYRTGKLFDSRD